MAIASSATDPDFSASLASSWENYLQEAAELSGVDPFLSIGLEAVSGGKHIRPRLARAGFLCLGGDEQQGDLALRLTGQGLEFFQASALVHDDIIDDSALRRGLPTAHVRFATWCRERELNADPGQFARAAALLLGNYLHACADECFAEAARLSEHPRAFREASCRMMRVVNYGQYLDMRAEALSDPAPGEQAQKLAGLLEIDYSPQVGAALEVMFTKTASYTGIYPLRLGGYLASSSAGAQTVLGEVGLLVGLAFQITDDALGVFGETEKTGKPVGDDLREGKRTLLLALARERASERQLRVIDAALAAGKQARTSEVEAAIEVLRELGAEEKSRELSERLSVKALEKARCAFAPVGVDYLEALVEKMVRRER